MVKEMEMRLGVTCNRLVWCAQFLHSLFFPLHLYFPPTPLPFPPPPSPPCLPDSHTHSVALEGIALHFFASMVSGLATTAASMPVDILKTRIQNMRVVNGVPEFSVRWKTVVGKGGGGAWGRRGFGGGLRLVCVLGDCVKEHNA